MEGGCRVQHVDLRAAVGVERLEDEVVAAVAVHIDRAEARLRERDVDVGRVDVGEHREAARGRLEHDHCRLRARLVQRCDLLTAESAREPADGEARLRDVELTFARVEDGDRRCQLGAVRVELVDAQARAIVLVHDKERVARACARSQNGASARPRVVVTAPPRVRERERAARRLEDIQT